MHFHTLHISLPSGNRIVFCVSVLLQWLGKNEIFYVSARSQLCSYLKLKSLVSVYIYNVNDVLQCTSADFFRFL